MQKPKKGKPSLVLAGLLSNRLLCILGLALVVLILLVYVMSKQAIYVVACDQRYELVSGLQKSPEQVLDQAGISLGEYDQVEVKDGQVLSKIEVKRAYPVEIQADGRITTVYTIGENVGALLEQQGITIGVYDAVSPSVEKIPQKNSAVIVSRGAVSYEEETVRVPYRDIKVESDDYYVGTTIRTSRGEEGEAVVRYALVYRDGVLVSKEQVSREISRDAVDGYIIVGTHEPVQSSAKLTVEAVEAPTTVKPPRQTTTKPPTTSRPGSSSSGSSTNKPPATNPAGSTGFGGIKGDVVVKDNGDGTGKIYTLGGKTLTYKKCYYMEATAFCHTQTALGIKPSWGTVAVDKSVIPLRTKLYVCNKYYTWQYAETAVAHDVGVVGERIDLWMNNNTMCYTFGRRPVWVYVLS